MLMAAENNFPPFLIHHGYVLPLLLIAVESITGPNKLLFFKDYMMNFSEKLCFKSLWRFLANV